MADLYTYQPPTPEDLQKRQRLDAALAAGAAMLAMSGGNRNLGQALGAGGLAALNARRLTGKQQSDDEEQAIKLQELRAAGLRAARKDEREQKGQKAYDEFNPLSMLPAFGSPTPANAEALANLQKDPLAIPLARASAALGAGGSYDDLARLLSTQLVNQRSAQNVAAQNLRHETPSGTSLNSTRAAWDRAAANIADRQARHNTPSASTTYSADAATARAENFPYQVEGDEGPAIVTRKEALGRAPPKKANAELPVARFDLEVWKANNPIDPMTGKRVPVKEPFAAPQRGSVGVIGGGATTAPKVDAEVANQVQAARRAGKDPAAMAKRLREIGLNPADYGL
jgi:hypothetical protein